MEEDDEPLEELEPLPPPPPLPKPSRDEVKKLEAQQSLEMLYALRSHTELPALESMATAHERKKWKFEHPEAISKNRKWKSAVTATRMGLRQMSLKGRELKAGRKGRRASGVQLPAHVASLLSAVSGGLQSGQSVMTGRAPT